MIINLNIIKLAIFRMYDIMILAISQYTYRLFRMCIKFRKIVSVRLGLEHGEHERSVPPRKSNPGRAARVALRKLPAL